MDRYHRQTLLPQIGAAGQDRLGRASVIVVGCGALGTAAAELLARAGVGRLRLIDRDVVELTNLQRQTLFDEFDVREGLPKAVAAARRLARVNSAITIEPIVADVHSGNIESLLGERVDVLVDGTDNAETRYLINDVAIKRDFAWIYGAAVGVEGRAMAILPGRSPCLRCVFPDPPAAGELPTCDTTGVLGPLTATVGALQASLAIHCVVDRAAVPLMLTTLDFDAMRFRSVDLTDARRPDCPACGQRRFDFLNRPPADSSATLCGQNAIQIRAPNGTTIQLPALAARMRAVGQVQLSPFLVRCDLNEPAGIRVTVFTDGRAIVQGTSEIIRARSIYAQYIGN